MRTGFGFLGSAGYLFSRLAYNIGTSRAKAMFRLHTSVTRGVRKTASRPRPMNNFALQTNGRAMGRFTTGPSFSSPGARAAYYRNYAAREMQGRTLSRARILARQSGSPLPTHVPRGVAVSAGVAQALVNGGGARSMKYLKGVTKGGGLKLGRKISSDIQSRVSRLARKRAKTKAKARRKATAKAKGTGPVKVKGYARRSASGKMIRVKDTTRKRARR